MVQTKPEAREEQAVGNELKELLHRAEEGDRSVLPKLRQFLDQRPEVWKEAGDLGLQAERSLTNLAAGSDLLVGESIKRQLEAMKNELVGASTFPLEKLLAERVVLTWLAVTYSDILMAQNQGRDLSPSQQQYLERKQRQAQQQFLAASKALATVRKLLPAKKQDEAQGKPKQSSSRKEAAKEEVSPQSRNGHGKKRQSQRSASLPASLAERLGAAIGTN